MRSLTCLAVAASLASLASPTLTSHDAIVRDDTEQGDPGDAQYRVELPPGVWQVRSADGPAWADGLDAYVEALTRYDLAYPLGICRSSAPRRDDTSPITATHASRAQNGRDVGWAAFSRPV